MDLFENVYENGIRIGDKYPIEHTNRKRVGVAEVPRIRRVEYGAMVTLKVHIPKFHDAWLTMTPWFKEGQGSGSLAIGLGGIHDSEPGELQIRDYIVESKLQDFLK